MKRKRKRKNQSKKIVAEIAGNRMFYCCEGRMIRCFGDKPKNTAIGVDFISLLKREE